MNIFGNYTSWQQKQNDPKPWLVMPVDSRCALGVCVRENHI